MRNQKPQANRKKNASVIFSVLVYAGIATAQTTSYPGAIDNNSSLFVVQDNIQTSLTVNMAVTDTVAVVQSTTGFVPNMIATICDAQSSTGLCTAWEHMLVTQVSGNVLTVTRGFAGTTARTHTAGRFVNVLIDSAHQKVLKDAVVAIETALGPNLSNVSAGAGMPFAKTYSFNPYSCAAGGACAVAGPSGMNLIAGTNSLTFSPVPNGVNATDTGHALYVSGGTGAAEGCTITGGSGQSNQPSGTLIVQCANSHSGAWTIGPASGGLQEAICALPASGGTVGVVLPLTLYANVNACGKSGVTVNRYAGAVISGSFTILGSPSGGNQAQTEIFLGIPPWTSPGGTWDAERAVIGNYPNAAEFPGGAGGFAARVGLIDIPSNSTGLGANGFAGYVRTASSNTAAVGVYGEGDLTANGTGGGISAWGMNTRTQNCDGTIACQSGNPGFTGMNLYGYEADINVVAIPGGTAPSGNVSGLYVIGGSRIQPTGAAVAVDINQLGTFNNIPWKQGVVIQDGAVSAEGVLVGATGTGNGVGSQTISLHSRSSGGTVYEAAMLMDSGGSLLLAPGVGGMLALNDSNLNAGFKIVPNGAKPTAQVINLLQLPSVTFATLGAVPAAGSVIYCADCTVGPTCAGGGTGHIAASNGTAWACN